MSTPTIEQTEKAKYEHMWAQPNYGAVCHSWNLWHTHEHLFPKRFRSFLDIGCGPGLLVAAFRNTGLAESWGVDITLSGLSNTCRQYLEYFIETPLWRLDSKLFRYVHNFPFELAVCTDVMEHIPKNMVCQSLYNIMMSCQYCVFKIDHKPDVSGGGTLHLTLQPPTWWVKQMNKICPTARLIKMVKGGDGTERASIIVWDMR